MVFVPGGTFLMGNADPDDPTIARPLHNVALSPFFIDKYEVTAELWGDVLAWSTAHGYKIPEFYGSGDYKTFLIQWEYAVAWCNARSEKDGLQPVYFMDAEQKVKVVAPVGAMFRYLTNVCVKWSANGYRLPTEAEWEYAARSAGRATRYPWGNTFDLSKYATDLGAPGRFPPNALGLYDMGGLGSEWCWDFWAEGYGAAAETNPHGPRIGISEKRVIRDAYRFGTQREQEYNLKCAARWFGSESDGASFRTVRNVQ
jgi:formylglycine-generating enzyme required for sulfatase activity